ncbi:MAG: helix-turn-helix domain-containing protein [Limnospira sp. PMC 1291.21]|uniref:Transcriptional regulator, HxlR family n=3 Tax=Limnospira TaxID=2596745 RepID=A0A9P1KHK9_9CYAN|nr:MULTISPECIES: helix-turn-helix domain-containing protein [Limnospira]EKD07611.1 transcriptional regulator HxlR family [Arthrospira platensis C1]MDC0839453.1 helix-turn-helix domain-containing protein [Limnoraphis robusta]MDY7055609.1 helix-turn-helix domain-containing protein [Limnospira fusiformis LS22]QJB25678.1 helix-turn-helix transcriptional regulator [Limnospira fusiformis SAG 85.79]EDZ95814.1 transcriptional regulator, HxlR family [Limnospira maxima CS-328]
MKVKKYYESVAPYGREQCAEIICPIQFLMDIIGSKWSVQILRELFRGDMRTHELIEALPGISTKTLTIRLRELEKYGLLIRTVYPEIPPHVEYSLTAKGRELKPVILAMKQVGEQWLHQESCICALELSG